MEGQEYVMTWGDSDGGRERERYAIDQTWMMGIFLNNRLEIGDMEVSGGRWWCSTLETGRKTPSTPSSPSRLVPQIFSENQTCLLTLQTCFWPNWLLPPFHGVWWLFSLLLMMNMMCPVKRVVASMAALQMASPHITLGPGADNSNLMLFYYLHFCTFNLRTKFVIGWKSEELQIWAWSRPRHSSTFGHLRPFCL